jgi:hypothetical protein
VSAVDAMADRYRVRVREEMTVVPRGADARELRLIIGTRLRELLTQDRVVLPAVDLERLVEAVVDDAVGLGPLEPLMRDPTVTEVIANGPGSVFVERDGKLAPENVRFRDAEHLRQVIERVVGAGGRRVDDASPMADVRLPDGYMKTSKRAGSAPGEPADNMGRRTAQAAPPPTPVGDGTRKRAQARSATTPSIARALRPCRSQLLRLPRRQAFHLFVRLFSARPDAQGRVS